MELQPNEEATNGANSCSTMCHHHWNTRLKLDVSPSTSVDMMVIRLPHHGRQLDHDKMLEDDVQADSVINLAAQLSEGANGEHDGDHGLGFEVNPVRACPPSTPEKLRNFTRKTVRL